MTFSDIPGEHGAEKKGLSPRGLAQIRDQAIGMRGDVAEQVVEAITNVARTGKIGDGKIFVIDLAQAVRIRTGETGVEAV